MALSFHPRPGTILICDYAGFVVPEMVKRRPVVVISPRLRRRSGLCTVVPLSTTAPDDEQPYHGQIGIDPPLPAPWNAGRCWAKADMLATVSFARLDLIRGPRGPGGERTYLSPKLGRQDLLSVRRCVLRALGMSSLTGALGGLT